MSLKLSVIIPTRFATPFLRECLSSINAQKISTPDASFDILIGIDNDPSTVRFLKNILPELPNTKVFAFEEHLGPYIIRNTLSTFTEADFLVFFDSDDIMPETFLQSLLDRFSDHDIVRFGFKDFIDVVKDGNAFRIFDKKSILKFEKDVVKDQIIAAEGKQHIAKRFINLANSKYLKPERYLKFFAGLFRRKKSGVFGIRKSTFMEMNGYKPWLVEADLEFLDRASLKNIAETALPKNVDFLRRIHSKNLTSNYNVGMHSRVRKNYQMQKKTSVYENLKMTISPRFYEIK